MSEKTRPFPIPRSKRDGRGWNQIRLTVVATESRNVAEIKLRGIVANVNRLGQQIKWFSDNIVGDAVIIRTSVLHLRSQRYPSSRESMPTNSKRALGGTRSASFAELFLAIEESSRTSRKGRTVDCIRELDRLNYNTEPCYVSISSPVHHLCSRRANQLKRATDRLSSFWFPRSWLWSHKYHQEPG